MALINFLNGRVLENEFGETGKTEHHQRVFEASV